MNYTEIQFFKNNMTDEIREMISALLVREGYTGFMETERGINAYIPSKDYRADVVLELVNEISPSLSFNEVIIEDKNWNEEWEKNYYKPLLISDKLLIRASFHKGYPEAELEIIIDPKTAFGTGHHATTYMLADEILQLDLENKSVLDMGAGTGILSILSKKLGAKRIVAVDNDFKAVNSINENKEINQSSDILVKEGTSENLEEEQFDFIYENIWKHVVVPDLPLMYEHLKNGGLLLCSGFKTADVPAVREAAVNIGFEEVKNRDKDDWAALVFKK